MKDARLDLPDPSSLALTGVIVEGSTSSVRVSAHGGHVVGDVLAGKYRITGFLGEGGMGTVWRARSLLLDMDVAIKVLHGEHADSQAAARLLREARATASLGHPAIVRILDFGETDAGESFLVMELLDGISLALWIDGNGRMVPAEAVRTLLPIADALVLAHAHGVVHRDVKPDNILLVPDGVGTYLPKILDFGIAKLLTTHSGRVLTQAGAVLGSLEYMSPEQAEGKLEVGEQTDVWALSVVLYELVTGARPFVGSTLTAILFSLLTTHPTPTVQLAAGDEDLWEIIARGLAKSPAERWPDMRAFGSALASWAVERGITTDATGTSLTHHWLALPSQPPDDRASPAPVVAAPMRVDSLVPARIGTIETAYVTGPTPPVRWTKAIRATAVAVLAMAPVLLAAGLYAHRGDGGASPEAAPAAGASMTVTHASAALSASSAIEPSVAATASASDAAPSTRAPPHRATPAARQRSAPTGMPLPAAPNF
jgi:serine/threonine-protein kinase